MFILLPTNGMRFIKGKAISETSNHFTKASYIKHVHSKFKTFTKQCHVSSRPSIHKATCALWYVTISSCQKELRQTCAQSIISYTVLYICMSEWVCTCCLHVNWAVTSLTARFSRCKVIQTLAQSTTIYSTLYAQVNEQGAYCTHVKWTVISQTAGFSSLHLQYPATMITANE